MRRVQMDLSDQSFQRLSQLKEKVEAASYSEVMKEALRLYEFVVESDSNGSQFLVQKAGEPPIAIKIF